MKKSKFKIVEDLMLFLSRKQHIFGLCFIISLIFITFIYENSNLNAEDVGIEDNSQLVRIFYEEITKNNIITREDSKLLSCGLNIESIFGIVEDNRILNKNLNYSLGDFKNNIKYSIDLYGIDKNEKWLEEKALFKVYTSKIYNPDHKVDVCTYDDNGFLLTGNENQSDDVGYILCDNSRMAGKDCLAFPNDNNDGSLECINYNVDSNAKKYCYSSDHICNTYKNTKNIVAVDKEFIDQYLEGKDVKEDNLGKYFYLFYKDSRPTDQEVKRIQNTVNCFQTFYNCDLTPYWNIKYVKDKLKDTGNSNITANEFVNVIINGRGDSYYNNQIFKKIINNSGIPLFVENTTERCCLKYDKNSCDYALCFAEGNKDKYVEYFKDSTRYKYIEGYLVKFFQRSISNQTCKNYLPDCTSVPTVIPLYEKIDGKVNIGNNEEQNSLYNASNTSGVKCLYAEGTKKNNKITYSEKNEDKSKSYCSDLLMDENGRLKLKYKNGLEKENGIQKDNCFLKSCIDLNQNELTAISGKTGVYCSPYRYLRDYDKIGVSLDLKFLPISDGKIAENYYCDNYDKFKNGIDHEKKENCYLRRCVELPEKVLTAVAEKRTASLFDVILKNVDDYVNSHSDSDFSSISDDNIKAIKRDEINKYCENRVFFTKSDLVEDNLNLLNCSEFDGKTVKSTAYKDIAFTQRKNLDDFLCVNFQTIIGDDIKTVGENGDNISFATDVFTTFGGTTNKISDNSMLSNFKFNANFLRYNEPDNRNICKGVDNTMIYISGDVENLNDELNFNDILTITTDKYFFNRCEVEKDENDKTKMVKCRFGNGDILNDDGSGTTKINNIKNNLIKKYFEKNIVDCADYGSEKEANDNTQRVVDCRLMDFLKQKDDSLKERNSEDYEEHYYITEMYDDCDVKYTTYGNENEKELFSKLQTFQANEGKLYLPVPLEKKEYASSTGSEETQKAVVCGYEGGADYNKFRKYAPTVGCYPLNDDFAYIDIATDYKELKDKKIVNIGSAKPKDFTFDYIPIFTRYTSVNDNFYTKCKISGRRLVCTSRKNGDQCGERKGGVFNDKLAILTSGNIDTSGEFKYIENNKYLTSAGNSSTSNFYKYGGGKYGNNICVFTYKDLSNCLSWDFNTVVSKSALKDAIEDTYTQSCAHRVFWAPGCLKNEVKNNSEVKFINYDTYQKVLKDDNKQYFRPSYGQYIFIDGIETIKFKDFAKKFENKAFNYGGSVNDYYAYNNDYNHGVLAKFNILSSYRGDTIRNTATQGLGFNTNFYENLNNRYQFSNDKYYKGLTTRKIIENCNLTDVFKDGQFNENVLNSSDKLEVARKCLKQYNADFFAKNPNEDIKNFKIENGKISDVIESPLKNKAGAPLCGRIGVFKKDCAYCSAIKIRLDNNSKDYQPFKIVKYIGNQEKYNEKNINCYFDNYGFPISNLKYCRGIFTTQKDVTNFDIYDENSDMKDFLPESQCLKLPLASAPQPYFDLATPYNTPSLFSPVFILTEYIKWDTTSAKVDFKTNGVSGVVASFFDPRLYFSYYFTSDENNKLFKNTENNDGNHWSEVEVGETLQDKLSTLKFASTGTGNRVFKKSFAGKKSFILSDKGFYYPIMCVSTYIDTERKSLNPVADQCDSYYTGTNDSCVLNDVENFVCVDRMVPTYENIYMRPNKNFSFRKPYINAAIFDKKQTTNDKYADENFVLEGDVEGDSKAIDSKGFNQVQQFGLKFERSLCSQLDIEYFDYLEKLNMLAEDNEVQRAIYKTELEKINEVIKPNCMEAQGEVTYLDKIDITKGECIKSESSTVAAEIPNGNVLLPINGTNLYLQCANENKIGKIIDRIKIVKNPVADKGHKEICVSDSNFEEMIQANKEQETFDYSADKNQVVVFNSANSTNVEDNKCLLDSTSRKNSSCKIANYVYVEDKSLSDPIITDKNTTSIFVSESDGSVYRVKKIDCTNVESINDDKIANIRSFSDSDLEKIKYCYKGGYNYSGNVFKADGKSDYSCKCMKKNSITNKGILENGIFSSRAINKRELGLCIDIDNAIPACEAISYKNPAAESNTSYEEQVKNMKFSKITALMSDLFKNNNGYEDERWEHIWRNKQKMFNSIGSYSGSSRFLGHAEFARYPYCDDEDPNNCFGKSKASVGTCSGFYRDGTRKVLAECVKVGKVGDKYEFKKTTDSGECVPDSCAGVGYTEVFNDLNTNEESLLNNNKNNKNFTQAELASYSNVQNSLNAFNTTEHNGEISRETIDNRGLFNGFAAWKKTQSDIVVVKQDAVACLAGYGPAGTNYIVHKFFPYIKNVEDNINFSHDFSFETDKRITNMNNLLNRQYDVFNELVGFSKNQTSVGSSLMQVIKAIARLGAGDFIYLHDNLPVRFCNQLGNWEESRDIYNNALKDGDKSIDSVGLRYHSKNDYYTDLKKGKKYLNNTVLSKDDSVDVPVFERANVLFNDGISDYNDSINTKYCERLFCQALSMDEVTASYGNYDIYEYEYKNERDINNVGSYNDAYYVTLEVDKINKYTPWRHLGGANWEATSAPRNHSDELIKGKDSYDQSNRIIDNVLGINGTDKDPTKIMYLKKVNGICDNKYGYYNRGTKFVLNSFNTQFETLKQKVLSQPGANNQTTVNVEEINAVKIGGAKTTGYETPFRTCSSIGLWSGVYNSCYRACEMIDMYHTNFSNDEKYDTFRTGKSGDINRSFKKKHYVSNGDVVSFNLYPSFDRFRINGEKVTFKLTNEANQPIDAEYELGDYLTGGASWPTTIVGLEKELETKFDNEKNLRYVEVEGTCDTTNPYNKTFVSNVDPKDYTKSLRPKRRCYENGEWGPIENLCVLFNTCNELSLNIFDLSNLLLQKGDINKMNKIINKKLLAQADCLKPGSDKDCYNNIYNAAYINRGFEADGLAKVEDRTIQNSISQEAKDNLFSGKDDVDEIISKEFFTVNAGIHVNPTETKPSIYVPLNLEGDDSRFAFTYANSNIEGCGTNDGENYCPISKDKSAGYDNVSFYKMQCNFNTNDGMPWKFASPYLGNYVYPMICKKGASELGDKNNALNRTRLFNNKNLDDGIDKLLMYVKESNFHVLSYLIKEGEKSKDGESKDDKSSVFKALTNCKRVAGNKDACIEYDNISYGNQKDFSSFDVLLPISDTENRTLSSYQHITYCDERYFYNERLTEKDTDYLYRPIVIECTKPKNGDSKNGKFTMLNVEYNNESFSAEQCYPRYCGRDFSEEKGAEINGTLKDKSDSKFTGNTIQNNWTLSHNNEYGENQSRYGEINNNDKHKINGDISKIVQCDQYESKSRLNKNNKFKIDKAYVLSFTNGKATNTNSYRLNDTIFDFYTASKDKITESEWIEKNYVRGISTICKANQKDIEAGIFNGITVPEKNIKDNVTVSKDILQHRLASLDLSVFEDQVKFCTKLGDNSSCRTVLESELASGKLETKEQDTKTSKEETAFANTYCVPMACEGEVDLSNLDGFIDPNKNTGKIYLDYDKYQIGDYVIIENVAGDFAAAGNTTNRENSKSNVYVMSTYLLGDGEDAVKGVKTDKNNNWYIKQYENGEVKETVLSNNRVDNAFGLVCQRGYDQYLVAGTVLKPTKESISKTVSGQCDLYIKDINMDAKFIRANNNQKNKHVEYTETLQRLIDFINKSATISENTVKTKINELLKQYIKNKVIAKNKEANDDFSKYVDYNNFIEETDISSMKNKTITSVANIDRYYVFKGSQKVENDNTNDNSSNNTTTTTTTKEYEYIVRSDVDSDKKLSSVDMTCGAVNKNYLFETSLCNDKDGKEYIKIKEHTTFKPDKTEITIKGDNSSDVKLTYQTDREMYILKSSFDEKYKNAFKSAYNKYIGELFNNDDANNTKLSTFYNKHTEMHLTNPNESDGNGFKKYTTYSDLLEQLMSRYKSIEYLNDDLFVGDKTVEEDNDTNISNIEECKKENNTETTNTEGENTVDVSDAESKISEKEIIKNKIYEKITENNNNNDDEENNDKVEIGVNIDKNNPAVISLSLNINSEKITNQGNLALYTLNGKKLDKHTSFTISIKNYRDASAINSIEDLTNNITIQMTEDLLEVIGGLDKFDDALTLQEAGFRDDEITQITSAVCADSNIDSDKLEECTNSAKREKAREILSARKTNNSIIKEFENKCTIDVCSGEPVPDGCSDADKYKVVTIDMSRLDKNAVKVFAPYIGKLVKANAILEELHKRENRETLVDKKYIEKNCVVFSDSLINDCYRTDGNICSLLTSTTSHFERLYIEEYRKHKGNQSDSPFSKGHFMALQCGVDGKWKLVGGNNAVQCKKRCDGDFNFNLNPHGLYVHYKINMQIRNLRYLDSGQAEIAAVGMYCSRGPIRKQSINGEVKFTCQEGGKFKKLTDKTYYPHYDYTYRLLNPGVRSTCRSRLWYFNGDDNNRFSYYRTAAIDDNDRNNRGVIVTCPDNSGERIIHHVHSGHRCGLGKSDCNRGSCSEYGAYHDDWEFFKCKDDLSVDSKITETCKGKFKNTATISYIIRPYKD